MRASAVLVLLMLAGCAGTPTPHLVGADESSSLPDKWLVEATECLTTAAFFLVDESRAHPFLPPGFHAADLSDFLYNTPVTSGEVPAFVATSTCGRFSMTDPLSGEASNGSLEVVYVGFYIHPPEFLDAYANQPSDFNFYAVSFLTPVGAHHGAGLTASSSIAARYGWNQTDARAQIQVDNQTEARPSIPSALRNTSAPDHVDVLTSKGNVTIDGQSVFEFGASAFFPQPFDEEPTLRFWQAAPMGVGFMEFELPQRTIMAGPIAECKVRPGSLIHEIVGDREAELGGSPCGLTDSFALIFDTHTLGGEFHHLPGVAPV